MFLNSSAKDEDEFINAVDSAGMSVEKEGSKNESLEMKSRHGESPKYSKDIKENRDSFFLGQEKEEFVLSRKTKKVHYIII